MSTTQERPTGSFMARTLITVLAVAALAACAMIGRAIQRVVTENGVAWSNHWIAGALLAVAAFALAAAVWLAIRAWGSGSPRRWRLLAAYSTASLTLCVAAVWLVLLLEDLSY